MRMGSDRPLSYFADENISSRLVEILRLYAFGTSAFYLHRDSFEAGTPDEVWLTALSKWRETPSILCGDGRILKNPARVEALKLANTHFIVPAYGFSNLPFRVQVRKMLQVWDEIEKVIPKTGEPTVFLITANAKLKNKCRLVALSAHGAKRK